MANRIISITPIKPKKMNISQVKRVTLEILDFEGKATQKLFKKPIATWKGDKPKVSSEVTVSGNDAIVRTGPEPDSLGFKKFMWLDQGTRVRYALMSPDWKSKTKPGRLSSGGGRGRVVSISRRHPRPGIESRGWTGLIRKDRSKKFPKRAAKKFAEIGISLYK